MMRPLAASRPRPAPAGPRSLPRSARLACVARASRTDKLRQLLKGPEIIKVRRGATGAAAAQRSGRDGRLALRAARLARAACIQSAHQHACSRLRPSASHPLTPCARTPQGPCCHDALSAKLIEQAGFDFAFMSGFCTSAARLGAPDTGLMSYYEMFDQVRRLC